MLRSICASKHSSELIRPWCLALACRNNIFPSTKWYQKKKSNYLPRFHYSFIRETDKHSHSTLPRSSHKKDDMKVSRVHLQVKVVETTLTKCKQVLLITFFSFCWMVNILVSLAGKMNLSINLLKCGVHIGGHHDLVILPHLILHNLDSLTSCVKHYLKNWLRSQGVKFKIC